MGLHHHQGGSTNNNNSSGLQLVLGLSLNSTASPEETTTTTTFTPSPPPSSNKVIDDDEPSLTLGLYGETNTNNYMMQQQHVLKLVQVPRTRIMDSNKVEENNNNNNNNIVDLCASQTSPHSVVSSFSSGGRVVKRERDLSSDEVEATEERVSSRLISDEDEDGTTARKKLRLTKDQSALLEDSFKQHSTLNPKQKQALARQLNLRPRQVEVWFQNRRARTKLKQTEVDCEFLKKCCETLTDENRRLQKELQELKALKISQPLYMPMPAATLTMCPSCERLSGVNGGASNKSPFSTLGPKSHHHFYSPFTNPSAAC